MEFSPQSKNAESHNDNANWFTTTIATFHSSGIGEQSDQSNHRCGTQIEWQSASGIVTNPHFNGFVLIVEKEKLSIFNCYKKGITSTILVPNGYPHGDLKYGLWNSMILFQGSKNSYYDPSLEKFTELPVGYTFSRILGKSLLLSKAGTYIQTRQAVDPQGYHTAGTFIVTDSLKEPFNIHEGNVSCSCQFAKQIFILHNPPYPGNNNPAFSYYDLNRKSIIDARIFICWLPDSLSFFEYANVESLQRKEQKITFKRFSK